MDDTGEVGLCLGSTRNGRSLGPLVTSGLCIMRRYCLGEWDLISTSPPSFFLRRATARLEYKLFRLEVKEGDLACILRYGTAGVDRFFFKAHHMRGFNFRAGRPGGLAVTLEYY